MADPLPISASVAGLMTIAGIVIRNGYKYITAIRDSDKAVASSMRTQVHHIESCYRTLPTINELLNQFELSKTKGLLDQVKQRLRWPLTHSETKALTAEVGRQKEKSLNLALNAMTSENEMLRWCSSLVRRRVRGDGIEPAHFTVKEYLLSIDPIKNPKFASFKICQEKSDLLLGQICLTYLNLDDLGKSPPPDDLFDDIWSDLESKAGNVESAKYSDPDGNDGDDDDESSDDGGDCADIDDSRNGKLDDNTAPRNPRTRKEDTHRDSLDYEKADRPKKTTVTTFRPWLDKYPLLQYAANSWYSHLRLYSEDPLVVRLTHKLFDPRKSYQFLWWSYAFLCHEQDDYWERTFPDCTTPWSLVSFLLEKGANIDARDIGGTTPCLIAAQANRWDIVRKYTKTTTDFNSKPFGGFGVLHYAVLYGAIPAVKFLQMHGISLRQDITNHDGKVRGNTVSCAAEAGNVDLFQMAWEDDAIKFINDYGWGLAHFAVRAPINGVRDLLLAYNVGWTLNTAVFNELKHSDLRLDLEGLLLLHMAAVIGNDLAINFLNDNNLIPAINATTGRDGYYSSLHLAAIFNRVSTVKFLKTLGANLDLKDHNEGKTALHHTARLGFAEIVTALLDAGCQPNPVDANGMTHESLALENNHQAVTAVISRHLDSLETKLDAVEREHPSTSVLESCHGKRGKPWRIPLAQRTHMRRVMTGNLSTYAIDDNECPEELHTMLAEYEDHGVCNLGKTVHKTIS